tara:strand:+ start:1886 stop:2098 length:213 start_codon:yes stop_codon:yes gene_type:complete
MTTPEKLNEAIFLTTIRIQEEFPELVKYLEELPETIPSTNEQGVSIEDLEAYLESLNNLISTYSKEHKPQ